MPSKSWVHNESLLQNITVKLYQNEMTQATRKVGDYLDLPVSQNILQLGIQLYIYIFIPPDSQQDIQFFRKYKYKCFIRKNAMPQPSCYLMLSNYLENRTLARWCHEVQLYVVFVHTAIYSPESISIGPSANHQHIKKSLYFNFLPKWSLQLPILFQDYKGNVTMWACFLHTPAVNIFCPQPEACSPHSDHWSLTEVGDQTAWDWQVLNSTTVKII